MIKTTQSSFSISKANLPKFFDIVSDLMTDENVAKNGRGGSWNGNKKTTSWYSWVNTDMVRLAVSHRDIVSVFNEWGYDLEFDYETKDTLSFILMIRGGEAKIGQEEVFFAAIAPVVDHGCFLDAEGEDGEGWRWLWENGKFYKQSVVDKTVNYSEPYEICVDDADANNDEFRSTDMS